MRRSTAFSIFLLPLLVLACSEGNLTQTNADDESGGTPVVPTPDRTVPDRTDQTWTEIPDGARRDLPSSESPHVFVPELTAAFRLDELPITGQPTGYTAQVFQGPLELTAHFSFAVSVEPGEDVEVTASTLTFRRPGDYQVTVVASRDDRTASTTRDVTVGLSEPETIALSIEPEVVRAGELAYFTVSLADSEGNAVDPKHIGMDVWIEPTGEVLNVEEPEFTLTVAGRYELHVETGTGLSAIDVFHVVPNDPESIDLVLETFEPPLAPGDSLDYEVLAEDAYGNVIETLDDLVVRTVPRGGEVHPRRVDFPIEGVFDVVAEIAESPLTDTEGPVAVDGFGPHINITSPDRGIFIRGGSSVTVEVNVWDAGADVDRVDINGVTIALDASGNGSHSFTPEEGVNLIDVDAWDTHGHTSNSNQSFLWGSSFTSPTSTIWNSVAARVNGGTINMLEDWVEDEVDTNQIRSLVLANPRIWSGCIDLLFWEPCAYVDATNFTMSYLTVNLTPGDDGYVQLYAGVRNPDVRVHLDGDSPSIWGNARADWVDLNARLYLWVDSSDNIRVSTSNISVNLRGFHIDISGVPDWLDFIEDWISSWVEGTVESAVRDVIVAQAPAALDGALTELEISETINVLGTNIRVDAIPYWIQTRAAGITMYMGTKVTASTVDPDMDGLGVLRTPSATPTYGSTPGFVLSIGDEFVNQALYAMWESGGLRQIFYDEVLPEIDLTFIQALVPGANGMEFEVDPLLPPVYSPYIGWGSVGEIQMGDTLVDIWATFPGARARELVARVSLSMFGAVTIGFSADNTVQIGFAGDPAFRFDGLFSALPHLTSDDLQALLEGLVPVMLPDLVEGVQEFPLPAFQGFTIGSPSVTLSGDEFDFLNVSGNLSQQ